jgi:hypothetical protein
MRLLVIFAAWAPDDGENSQKWLAWYENILAGRFPGDDKIVAANWGSAACVERRLEALPRLLEFGRVPQELHVNSDAAPFQLGLKLARGILLDYDYVLFAHTKGVSYPFEGIENWRNDVSKTVFDRRLVSDFIQTAPPSLIADRGHMVTGADSIEAFRARTGAMGFVRPFFFGATMTVYYAPARLVAELIERMPGEFLSKNLLSQGMTRYMFEAPTPSLLAMLGAKPAFLCGPRFNERLNPHVSYDFDPRHNSALVMREFEKKETEGEAYRQMPVPYVFGAEEDVYRSTVAFKLT